MPQEKSFPEVSATAWRALVEKELAGASFEKTLTTATAEGLTLQPLYWEAAGHAAIPRGDAAWKLCSRVGADAARVSEEIDGGATALWVHVMPSRDVSVALAGVPAGVDVILDAGGDIEATTALARLAGKRVALAADPLGAAARAGKAIDDAAIDGLAALAKGHEGRVAVVDTIAYHGTGANAAEEIGFALATGVAYLRALERGGVDAPAAAARLGFRVAVGRDTFGELAKLRALRRAWQRILAAAGAADAPAVHVHAVASPRTISQRDPWVNMLRVTTEVFAAILGGADAVTPEAFDAALSEPSELGRRVARNTALVLGHESYLGRVGDPAAGSYYLDQLTDGLARAGWAVFQAIEREGGMARALASGKVRAMCDASYQKRVDAIGKRKEPLTGVSEFANLGERLPSAPAPADGSSAFPLRRDAAPFEALRDASEPTPERARPRVALAPLGPLAEHKPRASFAQNFFQAGGFAVDEDAAAPGDVAAVVLCGSDERYAAEAAAAAAALRARGARRIYLAGRPGALEGALREAGVTGFVFVGCDVVATLRDLLESIR